jgi:tetratricopeptide (TPR) repeat protein
MRYWTLSAGMAAMFAAAGSVLAPPALADDAGTCANGAGDAQIAACTRSINSGKWRGHDLAWAYVDRGKAYNEKGDNVHAVADYDVAIRLDPKDAVAYNV